MSAELEAESQSQTQERTFFSLNSSLWACLIASLVLRGAASAMGVMVGFYLRHLHDAGIQNATPLTVALFAVAFFATELIGAPIFGAWSDRYGRKPFMVLGPLFGAIAVQITAVTAALPLLLITRLLEGLSTASSLPATLSYISNATSHNPVARGRAVSLWEITTIGGLALGFRAAGTLWDDFGRTGFSIVAVIYLLSAVIFYWGMRHQPRATPTEPSETHRLIQVLRQDDILRFAPAWVAFSAIVGLWLNHLPYQLSGAVRHPSQNLTGGFSGRGIGTMLAGYALLFSVGVFLWGLTFARIRRVIIMLIANVGVFIATFASYGINHVPLDARGIVILLGVVFVGGVLLESGFTPAALGYLADISENYLEDRGAIMGLYSVLLGIGQLIGGGVGGPFAQRWGMDGVILLTALFALVALATVLRLYQIENNLARAEKQSPTDNNP
ncbi:MAG: MFS transporter [Chloroflexi bacterium]|nr:MAG: MFS transporter [Chloroflexota bacterium]